VADIFIQKSRVHLDPIKMYLLNFDIYYLTNFMLFVGELRLDTISLGDRYVTLLRNKVDQNRKYFITS
jgi:hypothetical protein